MLNSLRTPTVHILMEFGFRMRSQDGSPSLGPPTADLSRGGDNLKSASGTNATRPALDRVLQGRPARGSHSYTIPAFELVVGLEKLRSPLLGKRFPVSREVGTEAMLAADLYQTRDIGHDVQDDLVR